MQSKSELIEQFTKARETIRTLLAQIDPHMEIYPSWAIKEVLAHLAGWDDSTVQAIQTFAAGQPPLMTAIRGINYHNQQTVEERKELTLEQVTREWEWVRGQLIPLIEQMSEQDFNTKIITPWGQLLSIYDVLKIMVDHEEEHAEIIRERMENPHEPPQEH
jgi:hypothetical protein